MKLLFPVAIFLAALVSSASAFVPAGPRPDNKKVWLSVCALPGDGAIARTTSSLGVVDFGSLALDTP